MGHTHDPLDNVNIQELLQRFWLKVNKTETCWLWTAATNHLGYGEFGVLNNGGCTYKSRRAHRVSWVIHRGAIPDGLKVLHKCDVRNCVNPAHLFLGTQQDNVDDMISKGRKRVKVKLNDETVRSIRRLREDGWQFNQISDFFNCGHATVWNIAHGRARKDVQ